eukprot:g65333.t1
MSNQGSTQSERSMSVLSSSVKVREEHVSDIGQQHPAPAPPSHPLRLNRQHLRQKAVAKPYSGHLARGCFGTGVLTAAELDALIERAAQTRRAEHRTQKQRLEQRIRGSKTRNEG